MKTVSRASFVVVFLLVLVVPLAAQSGPSTNGDFQQAVEDGTRSVVFNARLHATGARGELTFSGPASLLDQDVDGDGSSSAGTVNLTVTVDIDCLKVNANRAAMSGLVTSSSVAGYAGRRIVLAVEDNGEGVKAPAPDRYTWGVYAPAEGSWTPADAELVFDNGASYSWLATDAERLDDVGIQYRTRTNDVVDCQSFPLVSYALVDLPHGAGNIQVRP